MAPSRESVLLRAGATIVLAAIAAVCTFLLLSRPDYRARLDPAAIRPLEGHAYGMLLPRSTRLLYELVSDLGTANDSELNLLEDGAPLGPAHSLHDAVRRDGKGAFSHWGAEVLFTASDNTDPRTNGRAYVAAGRYELRRIAAVGLLAVYAGILLALTWIWLKGASAPATRTARRRWNATVLCAASQGAFFMMLCLGVRYRIPNEFLGFSGTMFVAPFILYAFRLHARTAQ